MATVPEKNVDGYRSSPPPPTIPSTDVPSASAGDDFPGQYHPAAGAATVCAENTDECQGSLTLPAMYDMNVPRTPVSAGNGFHDHNHTAARDNPMTSKSPNTLECAELREQLADVTCKYTDLQENHQKANGTIKSLKKKVKVLEKELQNLKSSMKFLNEDQLRALSRDNTQGCTWSVNTIKQALQIKYACGTSGYETLRTLGYPLPSNRTLGRRLQGLSFLPGILSEVFDVLKSKTLGMEDIEKDCVLFLDEMEIMQGYEHDRSEDSLLGGVTLPDRPEDVANHALVFMVGGLNRRWKQVIAYHLTGRSVDGSVLKGFVFELVRLCSEISLRVLVVTSDMGAANRGMWRALGFSSHRNSQTVASISHPQLDGRELFFMADPAHVLKNIRGQFINSTVFSLGDETVARHQLPTSEVKLDYVEAVIEYDSSHELKVAPQLSEVHTSTGHFTKMKVGVAVKLFRESPPAIRYLIEREMLPKDAESTAWFMELVSNWYKLMSARHPMFALSRIDTSKYQSALEILSLAVDTVQTMKMGVTAHWKPSQAGLLISTHVVLKLQESLLGDRGYRFLLTGRLTQDCLENLFSVIRLRKPVPNAYDMKCALKLVCVSQFLHTPSSSSYELDDSVYLADLLAHGTKHTVEDADPLQDVENLFVETLSIEEEDILCYVGGFILKGMMEGIEDCQTCKGALLGGSDSQYGALTLYKEYVQGANNLLYPTDDVMNVLQKCEEYFKSLAASDSLLGLKSPVRSIAAFLLSKFAGNLPTCDQHREKMDKLLMDRYSRLRLKIYLRHKHRAACAGLSSKTCAGVGLA